MYRDFKHCFQFKLAFSFIVTAVLILSGASAQAAVVTPDMAKNVVQGWLNLDPTPLKSTMSVSVQKVDEYDDNGLPAYYIVHMNPKGLVIVSGDTDAEPIVGFLPDATGYINDDSNPLGALIRSDLPARTAAARAGNIVKDKSGVKASQEDQLGTNEAKWNTLLNGMNKGLDTGSMDDIRVDALVQSTWAQGKAPNALNCYNAFTPSNYVSGCVATAMGQLMRFHKYPVNGVGDGRGSYSVDSSSTSGAKLGGDDSGGPYVWDDMVLQPDNTITQNQCDAIGRLLFDAGITVGMAYTSSSSGTDTLRAASAFTGNFSYANSVKGSNGGHNVPSGTLTAMVNTNLDYKIPVLFGINGTAGGHAIVGDGYGYNGGTMYHHLNMGWSGSDNAWYNLPTIDAGYEFDEVYKIVYNTFKTQTGEIVSGRVEDSDGNPISGVTVTANSGDYATSTDSNGIYALLVPSDLALTISAIKEGYTFSDISVSTGTSTDYVATGNVWAQDFTDGGGGGGGGETIPGLNEWGMLITALLLGSAVILNRRHRFRANS